MISKQYIKDLEFNNIDEFYNYVIESKINGNYKQVCEFVRKMSKEQVKDFKNYVSESFASDEIKEELINIIIEVA